MTRILFNPDYAARSAWSTARATPRRRGSTARRSRSSPCSPSSPTRCTAWTCASTTPAAARGRTGRGARRTAGPTCAGRKGQWQRARSQLVDEFLAVDGAGARGDVQQPLDAARCSSRSLQVLREQLNATARTARRRACTWAQRGPRQEARRDRQRAALRRDDGHAGAGSALDEGGAARARALPVLRARGGERRRLAAGHAGLARPTSSRSSPTTTR